jgi:hypothetical protein
MITASGRSSLVECVSNGHQLAIPAVKTSNARSGEQFTASVLRTVRSV